MKNVFRVWSDNSKLSQMPHRENYSITVVFSVKPSEKATILVVQSDAISHNHNVVSTEKRKKTPQHTDIVMVCY